MKNDIILTVLTTKSEEIMKSPEFVDQIFNLAKLGWGKARIAKKLGTTKKTENGVRPDSLTLKWGQA